MVGPPYRVELIQKMMDQVVVGSNQHAAGWVGPLNGGTSTALDSTQSRQQINVPHAPMQKDQWSLKDLP